MARFFAKAAAFFFWILAMWALSWAATDPSKLARYCGGFVFLMLLWGGLCCWWGCETRPAANDADAMKRSAQRAEENR